MIENLVREPALFGTKPLKMSRAKRRQFESQFPLANLLRLKSIKVIPDKVVMRSMTDIKEQIIIREAKYYYLNNLSKIFLWPAQFTLAIALALGIAIGLFGIMLMHTDKLFGVKGSDAFMKSEITAWAYLSIIATSYLFITLGTLRGVIDERRNTIEKVRLGMPWQCTPSFDFMRSNHPPCWMWSFVEDFKGTIYGVKLSVYHLKDNHFLMVALGKESYWVAHW